MGDSGATLYAGVWVLVTVFATIVFALVARCVPNRAVRLCMGSSLIVLAVVLAELSFILTVLIASLGATLVAFAFRTTPPNKDMPAAGKKS